MGVENEPWWTELLSLRSELSLRELATKFGASPGEISIALKREGVRRTAPRPANVSVAEVTPAKRRGSKDAQLDAVRDQLGKASDAEIAERIGVSARTVASYRRRNGIDAFSGRTPSKKRFRKSRIDPFVDLVGKLPDRVVAERANVTLNAVRNYRTNRGIPSSRTYARLQREKASTNEPPPVPTATVVVPVAQAQATEVPSVHTRRASAAAYAWKIVFQSGAEGVITAGSIASAVQAATSLDPAVVSVARLGRML